MRVAMFSMLCIFALAGCHQTSATTPTGKQVKINSGPPAVLERGETTPVQFDIFRSGFNDAVTVTISDLPPGVTAAQYKQTADGPSTTFQLTAAPNAELVAGKNGKVVVNGPDNLHFEHAFPISVKD